MASTINASSSGSGGLISTGDASGTLELQSNGSVAVTVNTSKNVGIGVAPSSWVAGDTILQIKAGTGSGAIWGRSNSVRTIGNAYYDGSNYKYIESDFASQLLVNPGSIGGIIVEAAPTGTAGANATFTQILLLEKDKSLALQGASPQAGTGITFPASQSASSNANTLDDYEEGTWSPTLAYSSVNPTITYTEQVGRYTKIGNIVRFHVSIQWTGLSGGSGNVGVALPFAISSIDSYQGCFMTPYNSGITPIVHGTGYGDFAQSRYLLRNASSNGSLISAGDVGSAGHFIHAGIYMVA